jgi:hypothetical protein
VRAVCETAANTFADSDEIDDLALAPAISELRLRVDDYLAKAGDRIGNAASFRPPRTPPASA